MPTLPPVASYTRVGIKVSAVALSSFTYDNTKNEANASTTEVRISHATAF